MDEKRKVRGNFRIYLQWPIFLSVLMVLLTAAVGAVSLRAGIIVSFFTLIYIGIALWIYFSRRKGILAGLIAFSQAYDKSKSTYWRKYFSTSSQLTALFPLNRIS